MHPDTTPVQLWFFSLYWCLENRMMRMTSCTNFCCEIKYVNIAADTVLTHGNYHVKMEKEKSVQTKLFMVPVLSHWTHWLTKPLRSVRLIENIIGLHFILFSIFGAYSAQYIC